MGPDKPGGPPLSETARNVSPGTALDAANLQAGADVAGELAAWAAAVVHLHAAGLPAAVPAFPAAWLRRRGIRPDRTAAA